MRHMISRNSYRQYHLYWLVKLCSKEKMGCFWVRLQIYEQIQVHSMFKKNDVLVSKSSESVIGLMFVSLKPKIGCSSSITYRWTHSNWFDVRKMMFKFTWCLMKWCLTHHLWYQLNFLTHHSCCIFNQLQL